MDEDMIKTINKIIYYIDSYNNGLDDISEKEMILIAKEIKARTKSRYIEFYFYKICLDIIKLKTAIYSIQTYNDPDFIELINAYLLDLYLFLDTQKTINKGINESIKTKSFTNLDDIYILSIKVFQLLRVLPLYTDDINKVIKENSSFYSVSYPRNNYGEYNEIKNEIESIVLKLKKDPE